MDPPNDAQGHVITEYNLNKDSALVLALKYDPQLSVLCDGNTVNVIIEGGKWFRKRN